MRRGNGTAHGVCLLHSKEAQLYSGGLKASQWLRLRPKSEEFFMFISQAFAQDATGTPSAFGSGLEMLFLFAPLMVVWYFFLIRPQRAQLKKRQETLTAIRRGDQVVLGGGIVGKVTKVIDDTELEVEIADGVKVRASRTYIAEVRVKGEPVKTEAPAAAK
jgi:preprotein translocase subunit YajC